MLKIKCMKQMTLVYILIIYCVPIWGQTDSLFEESKSRFLNLGVHSQINKDTLNDKQLFYIRQCYSKNKDFSNILLSIAESKPYTMVYKVVIKKDVNNRNIISFVQCESCDDIISEILDNPNVSINGCIIVNNVYFYITNKMDDDTIIEKLIENSDSYTVIMKINYPEFENCFFYYNKSIPLYEENNGRIYKYKNFNEE